MKKGTSILGTEMNVYKFNGGNHKGHGAIYVFYGRRKKRDNVGARSITDGRYTYFRSVPFFSGVFHMERRLQCCMPACFVS
jgi:hypothetical protein